MKLSLPVKMILSAVIYVAIVEVLSVISTSMTMSYYTDPAYFAVWSKLMMPGPGPPPTEFFYLSVIFSFIIGLIYTFVYSRISNVFKSKSVIQKGLRYGFALFLIAGIPFFLNLYLLINLPLGLLISWLVVNGLVGYLIAGVAIAKIMEL